MKQTAVEWLIDEIKFARNLCDDPNAEMDIWHTLDVLIAKGEEAKEMEKEQHKQTWFDSTAQFDNAAQMTYKKDFEQYYNETSNAHSIVLFKVREHPSNNTEDKR